MKMYVKSNKNRISNSDMVNELINFGFEQTDEPYYDYFLPFGLYATWDVDRNEGYFTWSPNGNSRDVGKLYRNLDQFLDATYDYSEYNWSELIESGLSAFGFTKSSDNEYSVIHNMGYCTATACINMDTLYGWVSYEYDDPSENERLDDLHLDDFIEECGSCGIF